MLIRLQDLAMQSGTMARCLKTIFQYRHSTYLSRSLYQINYDYIGRDER